MLGAKAIEINLDLVFFTANEVGYEQASQKGIGHGDLKMLYFAAPREAMESFTYTPCMVIVGSTPQEAHR